jgi:hypothetical protein
MNCTASVRVEEVALTERRFQDEAARPQREWLARSPNERRALGLTTKPETNRRRLALCAERPCFA